jgi:hypothetical protein
MLPAESLQMRNGYSIREGVNLQGFDIFMHLCDFCFDALECGVGKKRVHCEKG